MKILDKLPPITLLLSLLTSAHAETNDCMLFVRGNQFLSSFPMSKEMDSYIINFDKTQEYYWMTEVGEFIMEKFIPNERSYSFLIIKKPIISDQSITDLLKNGVGSMQYSSIDLNIKNKDKISFGGFYGFYRDGDVFIGSDSESIKNEVFKNFPSYARLTFNSPNDGESYSCITKIEYLNQ